MKELIFILFILNEFCNQSIGAQQLCSSSSSQNPIHQLTTKEKDSIVFFTPPSGWLLADSNILPKHVHVMVVGKGPSSFPPSINLSWEPYKGSLKQYLQIVKNMNAAKNYVWKDLGPIQTGAGIGNLSQVDTKTQWGDVRLMHVILVKNENVYILTASALKDEFSIFYKDFFTSMRSLKIAKDLYEMIPDTKQRTQLKAAVNKLTTGWQTLLTQKQKENDKINQLELRKNVFNSEDFQNNMWKPFKEMLQQKCHPLGKEWHSLFLEKLENQLFEDSYACS